jgi:pimeloyl-ACP methyl ester carboxylesterase
MDATDIEPAAITKHTEQIAGTKTVWRSAPSPEGQVPVLYVHGVPNSSEEWGGFLERTGGVAIDLPGFGQSDKPQNFEYSIGGYNAFLQAFIGQLEWDRFSVVVHDWGGLALVTAQELHERIDRMVIINAVPLLPGYRWHRLARGWRTPVFGEFLMGLTTKTLSKHLSKESRPSGEPWPKEMLDTVWSNFDHGTQRAILRLYRSAPPEVLEQAGERLGLIEAPTLVLWGKADPYIPDSFAQAYVDALPNAELKMLGDAGHWPWLDRPDTIDQATDFLLNRNT